MTIPPRPEYEQLIYGMPDAYPNEVIGSTLRLYSTSAFTAIVEGKVKLSNGLVLKVLEALDFKMGRIRQYSYTVFRGEKRIRWYDPQPHPEDSTLAETFPPSLPRSP